MRLLSAPILSTRLAVFRTTFDMNTVHAQDADYRVFDRDSLADGCPSRARAIQWPELIYAHSTHSYIGQSGCRGRFLQARAARHIDVICASELNVHHHHRRRRRRCHCAGTMRYVPSSDRHENGHYNIRMTASYGARDSYLVIWNCH